MEMQLLTFYNCTTGHPSERELLDQPKKTVESFRRAFLQERSKRNGKKPHLEENHQKDGVARDLDRARPQNVFFIWSSRNDCKRRKKRKKIRHWRLLK